jgi:uncharacterized protein (DUF3084 family)
MSKLIEMAKQELANCEQQIAQRSQQVQQLQAEIAQLNEYRQKKLEAITESEPPQDQTGKNRLNSKVNSGRNG